MNKSSSITLRYDITVYTVIDNKEPPHTAIIPVCIPGVVSEKMISITETKNTMPENIHSFKVFLPIYAL